MDHNRTPTGISLEPNHHPTDGIPHVISDDPVRSALAALPRHPGPWSTGASRSPVATPIMDAFVRGSASPRRSPSLLASLL